MIDDEDATIPPTPPENVFIYDTAFNNTVEIDEGNTVTDISPSMLRSQYFQYIDEHKTFPEHMKQEMKNIVEAQFHVISLTMGVIEITDMRAKDEE